MKLDLNPEVEAGLVALAQAQGLSLEAFVEKVLRERSTAGKVAYPSGADQKAEAFRAFARDQRHTPSLSGDAVSRQQMNRDGL